MKPRSLDPAVLVIAGCLGSLALAASTPAQAAELKVKVIKACPDCVLPAAPQPCTSASALT